MTAELEALLARHMGVHPEISRQEALLDLWNFGHQEQETYEAYSKSLLRRLDAEHNVINHPDRLKGWHVVSATIHKHNVYRFTASRSTVRGFEMMVGYARQDILRVAIEHKICTKPNGFVVN